MKVEVNSMIGLVHLGSLKLARTAMHIETRDETEHPNSLSFSGPRVG